MRPRSMDVGASAEARRFRSSNVAGKHLSVRYDPWDASSVYVRVKDQWHQAVCRNLHGLGQLTEAEQKALSEEIGRAHV